jgi:hypothetical protein
MVAMESADDTTAPQAPGNDGETTPVDVDLLDNSPDTATADDDTATADDDTATADDDTAPPPPPRGWKHLPRSRKISALVLSALVSLGLALIVSGIQGSVTGRERSRLPEEIERIQPALGDKVLNQANIVVDLTPGYTGRLIIDDVVFPTVSTAEAEPAGQPGATPTTTIPFDPNTVRFDAGTNTLSYQPRPGAVLERFEVGRHTVKVIYWKVVDGEAASFSFFWYFDVTA